MLSDAFTPNPKGYCFDKLGLVVEVALQGGQSISPTVGISTDSQLRDQKENLKTHIQKVNPFKQADADPTPPQLSIATQNNSYFGDESLWRIDTLNLEKFADVIWNLLVQKRNLQTIPAPGLEYRRLRLERLRREKKLKLFAERKQELRHREVSNLRKSSCSPITPSNRV